mgnify:CR=1 FL=1
MNRCVVVGAAKIKDYDNIRRYLSEDDFYIFYHFIKCFSTQSQLNSKQKASRMIV